MRNPLFYSVLVVTGNCCFFIRIRNTVAQAARFASCETGYARTYEAARCVWRLVSSLPFANTSASQNKNRRWKLHARVASIVSTSPQAGISPETPACSHIKVLSQETGLAPFARPVTTARVFPTKNRVVPFVVAKCWRHHPPAANGSTVRGVFITTLVG